MEPVLCIDATSPTVKAAILKVSGRNVEIVERHSSEISGVFSFIDSTASEESNLPPNTNGHGSTAESLLSDHEHAARVDSSEPPKSMASQGPLAPLLSQIKSEWTNLVLIVPSKHYLSLNLELPFGDYKNINKILDMEVQDLVPFNIDEFLLQPRPVSSQGPERHDVHVSIIPKQFMRHVLDVCRQSALDPYIVCTPSAILAGIYFLAPQYMSQNSAILFRESNYCYILVCVDGVARTDRVIAAPLAVQDEESNKKFFSEIRLTLTAAEKRYDRRLERVYALGSRWNVGELQLSLARDVESLRLPEFISSARDEEELVSLGALFAQDSGAPVPLTNFRVREFVYRPQLHELLKGLKTLFPYVLAALLATLVTLISTYLVRERRYNAIASAIETEIARMVPSFVPGTEDPVKFLSAEQAKLEQQLTGLGSLSQYDAVDALVALSHDIDRDPSISLSKINVEGSKIVISGTASNYSTVEKMERTLKRSKSIYAQIKPAQGPGRTVGPRGGGQVSFSFEILLQE